MPLLVGFVYYHPKTMGNSWMASAGLNQDSLKIGNIFVIYGLTLLFSMFMALTMNVMVIHQMGFMSTMEGTPGIHDANSEVAKYAANFYTLYGDNFRTFKHGVFHGVLYTLFLVLPIVGIVGMFERRSFKYIFIHVGYWLITFALMGGIISAWK
jgi:cytochrome b561